jgi:hypothetical protein
MFLMVSTVPFAAMVIVVTMVTFDPWLLWLRRCVWCSSLWGIFLSCFCSNTSIQTGARCWWRSWLRHCATRRKVAGSIPDDVTGIFHWHNPSGRTMALGLTQPLTEMSTRNISWGGEGGRCTGLTTLPPSCADCLEIWDPQPPGTFRVYPGL